MSKFNPQKPFPKLVVKIALVLGTAVLVLPVALATVPTQNVFTPSAHAAGKLSGLDYTVAPGDTLFSVARALHISEASLVAVNHLTSPYELLSGEVLKTHGSASSNEVAPSPAKVKGVQIISSTSVSSPVAAAPANLLTVISSHVMPNGEGEVLLKWSHPVKPSSVFATSAPPTLAFDFADAGKALSSNPVVSRFGPVSNVTAVAAQGRVRVVLDLKKVAKTYHVGIRNGMVAITIPANHINVPKTTAASITSVPVSAPVPTTHKVAVPVAVKVASSPVASTPVVPVHKVSQAVEHILHPNGVTTLSDLGFSYTGYRSGQLVLSLSDEDAKVVMDSTTTGTVLDIPGASLASGVKASLDTSSYDTPVQAIKTTQNPDGVSINIATVGSVQVSSYQTGDKYVVNFVGSGGAAAPSEAPDEGPSKHYTGQGVTLNFQNIPVRSVLQLLATVSHLNIVTSDSVQGSVTLRLNNVPWDQALAVILRAKGLAERRNGDVVWVAPQSEIASYEDAKAKAYQKEVDSSQLVTAYIPINYGSADDIAKLLTSSSLRSSGTTSTGSGGQSTGFLSPRGSVSFDKRTNTLLISDIPSQVEKIKQLVSVLDRPVRQVLIQARLVVATNTFSKALGAQLGVGGFGIYGNHAVVGGGTIADSSGGTGITGIEQSIMGNWSGINSTGGSTNTLLPNGLNVNLPAQTTNGVANSGFSIGLLGHNYLLNLQLTASQQDGTSETISQPRVIASNNQEAKIEQGQEIGYVTFQNSGGGAGAGTATVQFKNVVLELDVKPTITSDGRVFMNLKILKDSLASMIASPGGGFVPQIDHNEVDTSVLVKSGQTVVLGGVYEFDNVHDINKVPFLGDIPILGALFRNKLDTNSKAQLMVFITPRILDNPAEAPKGVTNTSVSIAPAKKIVK